MIFITGCNGLIGSFLARALLNQGEKVRALKRENSDLSLVADIHDQIEWVEGDVLDVTLLQQALKDVDQVVHSAAIISFSSARRKEMYKINVEGTANVVNASLLQGVKSFCHVSSIAAIGRSKDSMEADENSTWDDEGENTHYARSKYLAELEVWRGMEEGLPAFAINPSLVIGPGNWHLGSTKILHYVYKESLFYPLGKINYVDVRDIVLAIQLLLKNPPVGERYILSSGQMVYKAFLECVAKEFGKKAPNYPAYRWIAEIVWRLESLRTLFTRSEPLITKETARLSKHSYFYKNNKIQQIPGFQFHSLEDTLHWTCQNLMQKYKTEV